MFSDGEPLPKPSTNYYDRASKPVLQPPVELSQYTSIRFTDHLAIEGIRPSIGSVGDAYDCETVACRLAA